MCFIPSSKTSPKIKDVSYNPAIDYDWFCRRPWSNQKTINVTVNASVMITYLTVIFVHSLDVITLLLNEYFEKETYLKPTTREKNLDPDPT